MSRPRPLIIGEQAPPLVGRSGDRLARLAGLADRAALAAVADIEILLPPVAPWEADTARRRAVAVVGQARPGAPLVALGRRVGAALGAPARTPWGGWAGAAGRRVLVLPHPSGRSRAWTDPVVTRRCARALRRLLGRGPPTRPGRPARAERPVRLCLRVSPGTAAALRDLAREQGLGLGRALDLLVSSGQR